jgi:phosphoribosylformylglycinamidine synthase I
MKPVGILRFLGTNCDRDVWKAVEALDMKPEWLWYEDRFEAKDYSAYVVPGGFSYGDYLRCGALAAKAPAMASLQEAAKAGAPVLGICNGFQILCEAKLLPGVLVRNESRKFIDKWVSLKIENTNRWSTKTASGVRLPIAHGEGRYYVEDDHLRRMEQAGQIWCRYENENPNGSLKDIAGVSNEQKNVCGLMPHPERAMFEWMGGADGVQIMNAWLGA